MILPPLRLPAGWAYLLRQEQIGAGPRLAWELTEWQNRFPIVQALALRYFAQGKQNFRWEEVLNTLPWPKLRATWAAIFLAYLHDGYYPAMRPAPISTLEELATKFSPPNSDVSLPRAYLLAFYLHVATVKNIPHLLPFSKKVVTYASLLPVDLAERDWAIVALAHYEAFLGREGLKDNILGKASWEDWWKKLNESQQAQMMRNLFAYAYSTHHLAFCGQKMPSLEE